MNDETDTYTKEEVDAYSKEQFAEMLEGEGTEGFDGVLDELYTIPDLRTLAERHEINLQGRDKKADIVATIREWAGSSDEATGDEDTDVDGDTTSDDTEEDSNDESDDATDDGADSQSDVEGNDEASSGDTPQEATASEEEHPYVKLVEDYYGGKLVQYDENDQGVIVFEVEGTEHKGTLLELYEQMIAEPVDIKEIPEEDVRMIVAAIVNDLGNLQTSMAQAVKSLSRELDECKAEIASLQKALKVKPKDATLHGSIDSLSH